MIMQYLSDEGYHVSRMTLQDEANVKRQAYLEQKQEIKKLKTAILEGDWVEVDKICSKHVLRNQKAFLYAVYKQQYLELIEQQQIQSKCVC